MKKSVLAERLAKKIERELGIICDPSTFTRTYVGYLQKSNGAWLWTMEAKGMYRDVGSCDQASKCVNGKYRLSIIAKTGEICTEVKEGDKIHL